jgi:hypothetical protein
MNDILACRCCGAADVPRLTWQACRNGRWHLRADCRACGAFLKWLEQTPNHLALAEELGESDPRAAAGRTERRPP